MTDILIANRHPVSGRPCCPLHGPLPGTPPKSVSPVVVKGSLFVLYDSWHPFGEPASHDPSDRIDGDAHLFTYECPQGRHEVVVYRVSGRTPNPGRSYMLTPGNRPSYYAVPLVRVEVSETMRYPVAEALLRRVWGFTAVAEKRRVQRQQRKERKTQERAATKRAERVAKKAKKGVAA